ncbi:hypothetical protein GE061_011662 [Apolygus lucorum]|uniref:SWIM-type domain-containing protein n=1 Tax=Apolygus lucorum TaxID=248454 RepID=A0A8S9XZB0_APOLU|nr:hypothetical protein GE061_011662 [Apolygus lucorum]
MFPQLLIDLEENENTREFGEYLSQHYAPTAKNWAYCFRMNVGINTNMQMERMHGIIKHVCMKIKKLKRMDKCLHALDRYLKDKMFGKVTAKEKGGKYSKKLAILRQRHQMALVATTLQVCQVGKNMWMVCSSTLSDSYSVLKVKSYCKNCDFASKCDYCNACSHMFLCSCCDNSVQKNMCKHIHRVCLEFTTWRNESIVPTVVIEQIHDVPDQEDSDSTEIGVAMLRGISRKRHSVRSLRDAKAKVHKVIDSANSDTQIDALYEIAEYAEALLHSLARKPEDSSPA